MSTTPTIRTADGSDVVAIKMLLEGRDEEFDERRWRTVPGERYLLVLDAPDGDGLAAAAQVVMDKRRGHLAMLVVAPTHEGEGLEDRFISVIEAMCDAFGLEALDVPPRRAA